MLTCHSRPGFTASRKLALVLQLTQLSVQKPEGSVGRGGAGTQTQASSLFAGSLAGKSGSLECGNVLTEGELLLVL